MRSNFNLHKTAVRGTSGLFIVIVSIFMIGCESGVTKRITMSNTLGQGRIQEPIGLTRADLKTPLGVYPVLTMNEKKLALQLVDLNQDGHWDKVFFLHDFKPNELLQISYTESEIADDNPIKKQTNIYYSLKTNSEEAMPEITDTLRLRGFYQDIKNPVYQMEGPALENDKVAFRAFFDHRNGKDIYGKITPDMVLDKVGVGKNWHHLRDWGMDILHVGQSLGAGGLGVIEGDSLYRLGDADTTAYLQLVDGPLYSSFRLDFSGWDAGTQQVDGFEQLSITPGKFYYRNNIWVNNDSITLVAGIAKYAADSVTFTRHNELLASNWTYDEQAAGTNTKLGMAILFKNEEYIGHEIINQKGGIEESYIVKLKPKKETQLYYFSCWEMTDQRFADRDGFLNYLNEEADKIANPIKISIN